MALIFEVLYNGPGARWITKTPLMVFNIIKGRPKSQCMK